MNRLKFFLSGIAANAKYYYPLFFLFVTYAVLTPRFGHDWDTTCWREWTKSIFVHGLGNAYKSGTDYLPLYQYVLFFFGKYQGSEVLIEHNIHYLKIITLLFDFIAGCYLIKLINETFKDLQKSFFYSLFFFFNISCFYNTLVWGQVDGIMACLLFLAFYYALKQNILLTLVFIILSLNFKLQSIVFIPLLGLMIVPAMISRISFKRILAWLLIPLLLQFLIILPFLWKGDASQIWNVIKGSVDKYPVVSMNAFNFWHWIVKGNLMVVKDNATFLGITYKKIGLLLFVVSVFFALLPLLKSTVSQIFHMRGRIVPREKLYLMASLIPLLFFFCNTQMHERYVHPALIFLAAYSICTRKYFPFVTLSVAYFLNLERVLGYLQLKNYGTLIFHPAFIAFLYFISIVYLFFELYRKESGQTAVAV